MTRVLYTFLLIVFVVSCNQVAECSSSKKLQFEDSVEPCLQNISSERRHFIVHQNKSRHAVKIPYPNWTSAQIFAYVVYTLLTEVMGYSAEFVPFLGEDDSIVAGLVGCQSVEDYNCANANIQEPLVHFSLESWMDGIIRASSFPPEIRPVLLNILSYPLDDGYFFWRKILEVGVKSPKHLALDQYSSYNAEYHHPHEFFDNFTEVLSLMPTESVVTCTDLFTDQLPYTLSFNSGKRALDQYISLTNDTDFRCEHGDRVWLSPACRS
jgi:hypothetical protein